MHWSTRRRNAWIMKMFLWIMGIFLVVYFLQHYSILEYFKVNNPVVLRDNATYGYRKASHMLVRRLLSEKEPTETMLLDNSPSPVLRDATALRRVKRDSGGDKAEHHVNHSVDLYQSQQQNNVFMNTEEDQLEWKIDVHVARSSKTDKSVATEQYPDHAEKISRNMGEGTSIGYENDTLKSDDSLGMKLTVEGRGGESSYTDLQKAWSSVGLFLKNFFEDSTVRDSENSTDVESLFDRKVVTPPMETSGEEFQANSNKTDLHEPSPTFDDYPFSVSSSQDLSRTENKLETSTGVLKDIRPVTGTQIIEDGFLEVEPENELILQSFEEIDDNLDSGTDFTDDEADRIRDASNSSERQAKPRFLFQFFNRGSGDFENSPTESLDTRRRDGRFILGFFRPRGTPSPEVRDSGSGDNAEDNIGHRRAPRVELDDKPLNMEIIKEADENTTNGFGHPEARFFFGLGLGSGDRRDLSDSDQSDECTSSLTPLNDTEGQNEGISHPFHESSQFSHGMNESEDSEDEMVLFQSITDSAKETSAVTYPSEELNPRFFGIFAAGSGDREFSWRKTENETFFIAVSNSSITETVSKESPFEVSIKTDEYTKLETMHPVEVKQHFILSNSVEAQTDYSTEDSVKITTLSGEGGVLSSEETHNNMMGESEEATEDSENDFQSHDFYFIDYQDSNKQSLQSAQQIDDDLERNIDATDVETDVVTTASNFGERHAKPRFIFQFFNRGSGDFENSRTESTVDTRRRDGRFILGFFRPRSTASPEVSDSGSGDNAEDNIEHRRTSRVETDEKLKMEKDQEIDENINEFGYLGSNVNFSKRAEGKPSEKEGRFFFGIVGFGSGDGRDLPDADQSVEYKTSSTTQQAKLSDYTETDSLSELKSELYKQDYFLESNADSYSTLVNDTEGPNENMSHSFSESSQFTHGIHESEDLENEMVLFQSITDNVKVTTEQANPTEEWNPHSFGIFAEGSGESEIFSWRQIENDTQTFFIITSKSRITETVSQENPSEVSIKTEEYTKSETIHPPEVNQDFMLSDSLQAETDYYPAEVSVGTTSLSEGVLVSEETRNSTMHGSQEVTEDPEDAFIHYQDANNESKRSERVGHPDDLTTSNENDLQNLNNQLFLERMSFSSGDGDIPNEATEVASQPGRGARLLDDYYGCYYPECSEDNSDDKQDYESRSRNETKMTATASINAVYDTNNENTSRSESQTASMYLEATENNSRLRASESAETVTTIPDITLNENYQTSISNYNGLQPFDTETNDRDLINSKVSTESDSSFFPKETSKIELEVSEPSLTRGNSAVGLLTESTVSLPSLYDNAPTSTPRPHKVKRCKASWQCDEKVNERCVTNKNGSVCDCGRSFVRHPTTNRCEVKAMVEAILLFPAESYHEDLGNPASEMYRKTKKAAKDTMKTILQENYELASTIADVEVVGFKPGSLIVIWNLIIPTEGNESLNALLDKVDNGIKKSLHSPAVLQKLPFKSYNVDVLEVHQSEINPCKFSSLNYCSDNAICVRDASVTRGFSCTCKDGFLDLSENGNYPGEICHATCTPDYCGEHGVCEVTRDASIKCNCIGWFFGEKCQSSGVVMVGSAATAVILLVVVIIMACLLWRYKRSSAYGSDVERRFQRSEEYGPNSKGTKALGDVLPMGDSQAAPKRFAYVDSTPHPRSLEPKVPTITVTSPSASDISSYFSDSTFDSSMKS